MSPCGVDIYRFAGLEKMYAGMRSCEECGIKWQEELEAGNGVGNENGKEIDN